MDCKQANSRVLRGLFTVTQKAHSSIRRTIVLVALATLIGCQLGGFVLNASDKAEKSTKEDKDAVSREESVNNIDVKVSVLAAPARGQAIKLKVKVSNNSGEPIVFEDYGDHINCRVELKDSKGRACEFTTKGRNCLSSSTGHRRALQRAVVHLQSGESKSWCCDLGSCFKWSAGAHSLSLATELTPESSTKSFSVLLKDIEFEIK